MLRLGTLAWQLLGAAPALPTLPAGVQMADCPLPTATHNVSCFLIDPLQMSGRKAEWGAANRSFHQK